MIKVSPSVLAADKAYLLKEVKKIEKVADSLHFDIMDGHFVPNITFGPQLVASLRKRVNLPFEVHLMVDNPEKWVVPFVEAGCDLLISHIETTYYFLRLINFIKKKGVKVGVALNPATPLCVLDYILPEVDLVLLMTVDPGFGGQDFLPETLPKIEELRKMIRRKNTSLDIEVDGGINKENVRKVVAKGANVIVAGTSIFGSSNPQKVILNWKEL